MGIALRYDERQNGIEMCFIVDIQQEEESRMTYCSRSEDISLWQHALTSKPQLTPRLGLCKSMSPLTDIFRSGTRVILDSHSPSHVTDEENELY